MGHQERHDYRSMITFDREGARFGFRVAAVVVRNGKALLHQIEGDGFWCLPGGRVELGEPADSFRGVGSEDLRKETDLWIQRRPVSHRTLGESDDLVA